MAGPEPWRKTGRKAKEEHWLGFASQAIVEVSLYDDLGRQQGRGVVQLQHRAIEDDAGKGQTWRGWFLAIEDGYYEWWVQNHYPTKVLPFHFCEVAAHRCQEVTLYRDPIHVDVFRVLPGDSYQDLPWMTAEKKEEAKKLEGLHPAGAPAGEALAPPIPGGEEVVLGRGPEDVQTGEPGIAGLARALAPGGRATEKRPREDEEDGDARKKGPKKSAKETRDEGLREVLNKRKAALPAQSALKLKGDTSDKKKKKKKRKLSEKKHKARRERAKGASSHSSDSEDDETSTSSTGSLFQLAALPQGVDRLHQLHQEKPGALADLTLRRFQELLNRSTGGGTAAQELEMPPVARAYLSQIYMVRNPESAIGLRNLRELRTLATLVDLMASNDPLRALDVAVQRMKSIELFIAQGQWSQANLLELIVPEEEQRAWFRQELKAAQQEHKSDLRLQRDQWPKRRTPWYPSPGATGGVDKKEVENKDGGPPENGGGQNPGKGKKGRGKGKKGKRW